ncbi:MAG: retropepsin-like aspartic protease, partial [Bdellovibrionota bacterium]
MKFLIALCLLAFSPLASAETCTRLPFRLIDNRIFLDTLVNGQGPFQFILDTGSSSNAIDTAAAKALGLPLIDPFPVGGAGPGQQTGYHTKVSSVQMGAIEMATPATVVVPMEN